MGTQKAISTPYRLKPEIINYANNRIFYKTQVSLSSAVEEAIWATDGTQDNTILLGSWAISGIPSQFEKNIVFKNEFYFTVFSNTGLTLMKSDRTTEGTVKVTKEYFTTEYSFCSLIHCGNFIYFTTGNTGISVGKELWRTDGTPDGTILIEKEPYEISEHFSECTCIKENLLYLKEFRPDKIWYVNEQFPTPNYFEINIAKR